MISKLILDFVGGVIHQLENVKFSKPYNKTFIKKLLDGKTNQNEYDNIKMLYSIIENKKNIQNKIFNKTEIKKQIEKIIIEIKKNTQYVYCLNEDEKPEGYPAKIDNDNLKKNSFSEEEPKDENNISEEEKTDNSDNENEENIISENDILEEEKTDILEEENEEKIISENEILDFDLEIKKMKYQKRLYDLEIKRMKAKQKEKIRNLKIEKMKAQQKPDEKEQLKEMIHNLYNIDGSYICDMLDLLDKLKPINKQKKEKIILNKERNIKALKVDKSKRFVCPWCFGFRMDYNKFLEHSYMCKKQNSIDEEKLDIITDIKNGEYNNFKCKTTEESIIQYNNKYGDELGYIEKY